LVLSGHILAKDKRQLAGQLWGLLQCFPASEIQELLQQAHLNKTTWLRPLTTSLTRPNGNLIRILSGHTSSVYAIAISPDGKYLISGSSEFTLKVWDWQTGEVIATFIGDSAILCCAVAPDRLTIVAGEESGRVHFLQLEGA
jgi:WD40 repeat protein